MSRDLELTQTLKVLTTTLLDCRHYIVFDHLLSMASIPTTVFSLAAVLAVAYILILGKPHRQRMLKSDGFHI